MPRLRNGETIEAHLSVFAALAVSRWIERQTGWSIRKFVKIARRYRAIEIQAGDHIITAADPLPGDLRAAITKISNAGRGAPSLTRVGCVSASCTWTTSLMRAA